MQNKPGVKQIAADRASRLPWLAPPAGYIVLIQDVAYGNRYKIARHQQLDAQQIKRGAKFPFETRVALIYEAEDAARAERDLHDELAAGSAFGEWFDLERAPLAPATQSRPPAPARPRRAVSLRELAQNDERANSLLQDAKVVEPSPPPSSRRRPASAGMAATRRRRPRRGRLAVVLGLLVLVSVLVAEHSSEIQGFIEKLVDEPTRQATIRRPTVAPTRSRAASPTPETVGRGEFFYTQTRARVRGCATTTCRTVEILDSGVKIKARRVVAGQYIIGSDQWIEFFHRGQVRYIHSSALSSTWLAEEPTPAPSPTSAIQGRGEVFYTTGRTRSRTCANVSCRAVAPFGAGRRITARRYVTGQEVNGSDRWIALLYKGKTRYIHESELSRAWPEDEPTPEPWPTPKPTRVKATAVGQGEVFYVRSRAAARHCARLTCEIVAELPPGTKITALRFINGQFIDGSELWIRFSYNSRHLSIHSSKLTRTDPNAESESTAVPAKTEGMSSSADDTYFVKYRARPGACARHICQVSDFLEAGTPIEATGFLRGDAINGDARWIAFSRNGRNLYIHSSFLTKEAPLVKRILPTSPTAQPTSLEPSNAADATPLWVVDRATAYKCVSTRCQPIAVLERGTKIIPSSYWFGQRINDSNKWIRLRHEEQTVYLHSSFVSEDEPVFDSTAQPSPTATPAPTETAASTMTQPPPTVTATVATTAKYVVETAGSAKAHIRACPSTTCDIVAKFAPGTEVDMLGRVAGETVYGTDVWLEIDFEGGSAYIHSALAEATE